MTAPEGLGPLLRSKILIAPMAGGPSTSDLIVAGSAAGAFAFVPAAYEPAPVVEEKIRELRRHTSNSFGVNLFVPGAPTRSPAELANYASELAPEAERLGVELGAPIWDDDDWAAKIDLLLDVAPAVCSFAFGCPPGEVITAFRQRGTAVMVTVTDIADAHAAIGAGTDVLCAQGIEAGTHRGTFTDNSDGTDLQLPTLDLVAALRSHFDTPIVAAGGIAHPRDVHAAVAAGAAAVQVGTAFLRCDESGASDLHKASLDDHRFPSTALTRAFTGRRARALENHFTRAHPMAPRAYPEVHHLMRPLRAAALAQGEPDSTNLWAGAGHRQARSGPAADIVAWLAQGVDQ